MIVLGKMRWGNLFSYGDNNELDFSSSPLTQILGANGHGKSSIALILEECLYNKNSKGIKKADILNRNTAAKNYWIELQFTRDLDSYVIKTTRGSTQTVKLLKNGEDHSSHTATATYKTIEQIIGYDHKTFAQIVYQSSAASLEFLTATDSNRKKFLIDLLNLSKYVEALEIFKEAAKSIGEHITVAATKVSSNEAWLKKYANTNTNIVEIQPIPEAPRDLVETVSDLTAKITNIDQANKKIVQNNKYKELLLAVQLNPGVKEPTVNLEELKTAKIETAQTAKNAEAFVAKMKKLGHRCVTCEQAIDTAQVASIIDTHTKIYKTSTDQVTELTRAILTAQAEKKAWDDQVAAKELYEELHSLHDPLLDSRLLDKQELEQLIAKNNAVIEQVNQQIKTITAANNQAAAHNARVEVVKTQLEEMRVELAAYQTELALHQQKLTVMQVLVKTFSSTGLVAYKIECLIKDLEEQTNRYLTELSSGRFQLSFRIAQSDKLNVVITDGDRDIDILALSSGERARVNVSALLGIRRLMQSLSNSRINLLILDETVENLDREGKEKLVEVLLQEEHLNTFVISHGFEHPLLEKIHVVKTKNISRIE
jgi:DNA repair exonuclease SbcCD ATPase subunit